MNGKKIVGWLVRGGIATVGLENGRLDNFFAWGGSSMCHPPVPLIEDDCALERLMKDRTQKLDACHLKQ